MRCFGESLSNLSIHAPDQTPSRRAQLHSPAQPAWLRPAHPWPAPPTAAPPRWRRNGRAPGRAQPGFQARTPAQRQSRWNTPSKREESDGRAEDQVGVKDADKQARAVDTNVSDPDDPPPRTCSASRSSLVCESAASSPVVRSLPSCAGQGRRSPAQSYARWVGRCHSIAPRFTPTTIFSATPTQTQQLDKVIACGTAPASSVAGCASLTL
jgi:hypothetical protein